jgi:pimeloyl-ACP methyl ester carboxylesterase
MRSLHFIRAAAAAAVLGVSAAASAGQAPLPDAGAANLTVFLRGAPVGTEQVTLSRTAEGWTIASSGRLGAPIDAIARRIEIRYTSDWRPRAFSLDGTVRGVAQTIRTVVEGNQAKSSIVTGGAPTEKTDAIDPNAVLVLPNSFFAPFEAVAARLRAAAPGSDVPAYGVPAVPFAIHIGQSSSQQIQTAARMIAARRTALTFNLPGASIDADLWTDEAGRMIRLSVPAQQLEVVRDDVASVASRSVPISRPNDVAVKVPANGFVLAGTLSRPAQTSRGRLPAVVLVGGSGPIDRDGLVYGIPVLGEIAGALADAGYAVLRYDKRGVGQSGGRAETAGLNEYAEDARAAVQWLADRKDVEPKRVVLIGHSEGGTVALLAASKDKKVRAVGLLATPGTTGAEVVLAQQQRMLSTSRMSAEEKQAAIDLQRRIHDAVVTGKGWEQLPLTVRRAVDTAEFQTLLLNDPTKVIPNVRQPILILQGALDTQIEPSNADRLEALAKARKHPAPVDVVRVPGVNHLLVPATTGDIDEYGSLPDKQVSPAVTTAIVQWLGKTR